MVDFDEEELYILYEAVINNIENLAIKPHRKAPRSGKFQYKWDILQKLKTKLLKQLKINEPRRLPGDGKVNGPRDVEWLLSKARILGKNVFGETIICVSTDCKEPFCRSMCPGRLIKEHLEKKVRLG